MYLLEREVLGGSGWLETGRVYLSLILTIARHSITSVTIVTCTNVTSRGVYAAVATVVKSRIGTLINIYKY